MTIQEQATVLGGFGIFFFWGFRFCLFGFLGFFGLHVLIFELLVLYIFFLHVLQSFTFINFLRISYAVS